MSNIAAYTRLLIGVVQAKTVLITVVKAKNYTLPGQEEIIVDGKKHLFNACGVYKLEPASRCTAARQATWESILPAGLSGKSADGSTGNGRRMRYAAACTSGYSRVILVLGLQQYENKRFCTYEGRVTQWVAVRRRPAAAC